MKGALDGEGTRALLQAAAAAILSGVDRLTEADMATGDGDHGIGMRRGFEAAVAALSGLEAPSPALALKAVGTAVMASTGGAAGAVFGTWFRAGARPLEGQGTLDGAGLATFLETGLEAVCRRGGAAEGQKTMIDALAPAARAARAAAGAGLGPALAAAAAAAGAGAEATRAMLATTGKARSLGERSRGHIDPGALSVTLILGAMRDHLGAG
ncbi:MAG: dihydroxyacetone kinase subunit L [Rhodobacteraceae bacterium]|nr:dihydroxyacetone kinase subunit L [Paracoccaceae bacterium]